MFYTALVNMSRDEYIEYLVVCKGWSKEDAEQYVKWLY